MFIKKFVATAIFAIAATGITMATAHGEAELADISISGMDGSVGYTTFVGPRLIDFAVRLYWDDLVRYSPNSGESALDAASYQLVAGATFHAKVM